MKRHLALVLMLTVCAASAQAAVRYVPGQYPTIQAAVNAASSGDVVLVAPGIYDDVTHPSGDGDSTLCVVVMKNGVTIRGSGSGATIIDALGLGRGILCDGITSGTIERLTIRGAFAENYGSGIYCRAGSSPTIRDCEITENQDGGIILRENSSPVIQNCRITDNDSKQGGGIAIELGSSPTITGCTITGNGAPSGAGIYITGDSHPTLRFCIVSDNAINLGNGAGGAILAVTASLTLEDCLIENNFASGPGGGVALEETTADIRRCLIQGNTTTSLDNNPGGGVYAGFDSIVLVEDCVISRNQVNSDDPFSGGGGISTFTAPDFTIRNCTIVGNGTTTGPGGGIQAFLSNPVIEKTIIANNGPGAGLACDGGADPLVSCTDIWGNQGGDAICGTNGGNNFSLDPRFCNAGANDFRLRADSPCAPGNHPDGPSACGGGRIGAKGVDCSPVDIVHDPSLTSTSLLRVSPNPSTGATALSFELPAMGATRLEVFDLTGRQIRVLKDEILGAGAHQVTWDGLDADGRAVAGGVYFARLTADGVREVRSVILTR